MESLDFGSGTNNPSDFEYIDLNYAVSNCKWSKYRPNCNGHCYSFTCGGGLSQSWSYTQESEAAEAQTRKTSFHANAALLFPQFEYTDFHALTALDLNADGTRLTSASSLKGPDKELWEKAHGEEIVRLIESETGRFIYLHEMPADRKAAY